MKLNINNTTLPIETLTLALILALRQANKDRGLVNIKGLE